MTDLAETATLPTAAVGTNMAAAFRGAGDVLSGSRSTSGVVALDSADQANTDALSDWGAIVITMIGDDNVIVFKLGVYA